MSFEAAVWRHRRTDPTWDRAHASNSVACQCVASAADRRAEQSCLECGGSGVVLAPDERPELSAELAIELGEFLTAKREVDEWGMEAWIRLNGDPDPAFLEALLIFGSELAEAEFDYRVAEADRGRAASNTKTK